MNDLEAIKWIMAQEVITLTKIQNKVRLSVPGCEVVDDTMIKCVIKMKRLVDA